MEIVSQDITPSTAIHDDAHYSESNIICDFVQAENPNIDVLAVPISDADKMENLNPDEAMLSSRKKKKVSRPQRTKYQFKMDNIWK